MARELEEDFIPKNTPAGDISAAGLCFPPCGKFAEYSHGLWFQTIPAADALVAFPWLPILFANHAF
jgi:hypothetical protein